MSGFFLATDHSAPQSNGIVWVVEKDMYKSKTGISLNETGGCPPDIRLS